MGEYDDAEHREGRLYPLPEEGCYGSAPKKQHPGKWSNGMESYVKRERKPKVYASYAISDKCELHSLVLDKYSRKKRGTTPPLRSTPSPVLSSSSRGSRSVSTPPREKPATNKRQGSLPPGIDMGELNMLAQLKLARELEESTIESLRDENEDDTEETDGNEEISGADNGIIEKGIKKSELHFSALNIQGKQETYMHSTGLTITEDSMTTYVI